MREYVTHLIAKLYTRHCDGNCGDDSYHDGHLTRLGQWHYITRYARQ